MSRVTLLFLQAGVAVISIALWYVLTTYPVFGKILLPPFFFSNPLDVAQQIVKWFASGVIWKHLWVTLIEAMPEDDGDKRFTRAAAKIRQHWEAREFPERTMFACG